MIPFFDVPKAVRQVEDAALAEIEQKMDKEIPNAISRGADYAFLILDNYSIGTRKRMPELVEKYRKEGWNAHYQDENKFYAFYVFFNPNAKPYAPSNRS